MINFKQSYVEIKKLEIGKSYKMRFMPNYFEPKIMTESLTLSYNNESANKSEKYFTYVLEDNKICIYMIGKSIRDMLYYCIQGYYGTPEGHFITNDEGIEYMESKFKMNDKKFNFTKYFANEDKSLITIDPDRAKTSNLLKFKDQINYNPRLPFDIKSGLCLEFNVSKEKSFLRVYAPKWVVNSTIWKEGDDKQKIIDLYNNVPKLSEAKEYYKKSLIMNNDKDIARQLKLNNILDRDEIVYNSKNSKWFFDDDARKYYWGIMNKRR